MISPFNAILATLLLLPNASLTADIQTQRTVLLCCLSGFIYCRTGIYLVSCNEECSMMYGAVGPIR